MTRPWLVGLLADAGPEEADNMGAGYAAGGYATAARAAVGCVISRRSAPRKTMMPMNSRYSPARQAGRLKLPR
jgi:hypothetical protein